ncbi:hypothetical protein MPER_09335 [Moniliophthora perniciosa FA553]|nr:hypothetical protein MPER_09335 [Moniliophthora perniciosa FA553]
MSDFTPAKYHYLQILMSFTHAPRLKERKHLTWGKLCLFLFLADSWDFVNWNRDEKLEITLKYAFLIEKAELSNPSAKSYIVWSGGSRTPRFKTKIYRISSAMLLGQFFFAPFLTKGSHVREDRCKSCRRKTFDFYAHVDIFKAVLDGGR